MTGFLLVPGAHPPKASRSVPRLPPFLPSFFSILARLPTVRKGRVHSPAFAFVVHLAARSLLAVFAAIPSPPPPRPASWGCWTRRLPLERKGRGERGLTPRHRRQAAPLVSAVHGCYEHSADDELFLLSLILSASLYSRITCIFLPPL